MDAWRTALLKLVNQGVLFSLIDGTFPERPHHALDRAIWGEVVDRVLECADCAKFGLLRAADENRQLTYNA
jgi:hypothetical protein